MTLVAVAPVSAISLPPLSGSLPVPERGGGGDEGRALAPAGRPGGRREGQAGPLRFPSSSLLFDWTSVRGCSRPSAKAQVLLDRRSSHLRVPRTGVGQPPSAVATLRSTVNGDSDPHYKAEPTSRLALAALASAFDWSPSSSCLRRSPTSLLSLGVA